jgi:hypothetical protein
MPREMLTDHQLIDLATAVRDERCVQCKGSPPPIPDAVCTMCEGTGAFALNTEVMLMIIAELLIYRGVLPKEASHE